MSEAYYDANSSHWNSVISKDKLCIYSLVRRIRFARSSHPATYITLRYVLKCILRAVALRNLD